MDETWHTGNANVVGKDRRGWIVGYFIDDPPSIRTTEGDYLMWAAGIDHTWQVEEESVVVTIRWPSIET